MADKEIVESINKTYVMVAETKVTPENAKSVDEVSD